jgi:hypothetical protein
VKHQFEQKTQVSRRCYEGRSNWSISFVTSFCTIQRLPIKLPTVYSSFPTPKQLENARKAMAYVSLVSNILQSPSQTEIGSKVVKSFPAHYPASLHTCGLASYSDDLERLRSCSVLSKTHCLESSKNMRRRERLRNEEGKRTLSDGGTSLTK